MKIHEMSSLLGAHLVMYQVGLPPAASLIFYLPQNLLNRLYVGPRPRKRVGACNMPDVLSCMVTV